MNHPDHYTVTNWATATQLDPIHVDCVTAIMLKILDGKCKMFPEEKHTMTIVYDVVKTRPGKLLGSDIHQLIAQARAGMDDAMVLRIYEQRLYAETMISRPVMKAFKAMLREEGILAAAQ